MENFLKISVAKNRVYGLDILRASAILFVLVGHSSAILPSRYSKVINYFVLDGVSIFFVLSGFLIGRILIRNFEGKNISYKILFNFWKRRWYRTLPNYFLILLLLILLSLFFTNNFSIRSIGKFFLFSQNLYYPHPSFFAEAWSLSVEEWFYLIIPIVIFLEIWIFKIKIKNAIILTAAMVILLVTFFRCYRFFVLDINKFSDFSEIYRKEVFTRLDSIMYGVIGAYIAHFHNSLWSKFKKPLFILGFTLLFMPQFFSLKAIQPQYLLVWSFTNNSLATLFLLPFLSVIKNGKGKIFKVITSVSLISYSMYLVNYSVVQRWILDNIHLSELNSHLEIVLKFILFWLLTIMISIVIYKYFEVPTTKLRGKSTTPKRVDDELIPIINIDQNLI